MTPTTFARELKRLKSEWPNSFGEARQLALWDVYRDVPDEVFTKAITEILVNGGIHPPRAKEFERAVEHQRLRWKERQHDHANGLVQDHFTEDSTPTPERIRKVRQLVQSVLQPNVIPLTGRDKAAGERGDD